MKKTYLFICFILLFSITVQAQLDQIIRDKAYAIEENVIDWRRHFHQNPELSNREFTTAEFVANHLRKPGLKVETGMAKTGVIGLLDTGNPGPMVAMRTDMDALLVRERGDIPFASKVESEYLGEKVGVMHACGYDSHIAILVGVAEVLNELKNNPQGKILFVFQPAEEGAPPGEAGGAKLMVKENFFDKYPIDEAEDFSFFANQVPSFYYFLGGMTRGTSPIDAPPHHTPDFYLDESGLVLGVQSMVQLVVDYRNTEN